MVARSGRGDCWCRWEDGLGGARRDCPSPPPPPPPLPLVLACRLLGAKGDHGDDLRVESVAVKSLGSARGTQNLLGILEPCSPAMCAAIFSTVTCLSGSSKSRCLRHARDGM